MNLNAIRNFAPAVRRQLIEAVGRKLDFVLTGDTPDLRDKARQKMIIKGKAEKDRLGLVECVAYTWFNRLAALRFLDARGWHPFLCRVLTPEKAGETQPEILKLARNGALPVELAPYADNSRINDLLDGRIPSMDPQGEVYHHIILAACRYYHDLMPFLFEALDDETELLLPDDLLTEHSVVQGFRNAITDEDCAEVEIIGWLYQFYISEKKDQVMARKSAVSTKDIPAVTQLFTPHWIVRFLVENSLGRLWLLNHPGSKLREHMPYYIEGEPETDFLKITKPEDIRLLDPASGSGHMLTYSFDLLYLIYEEEGHAPSEIPDLILHHNLFGLEICPRATQLAQFALVCKAREKSRLAFRKSIQPQVMCLEDVEISPEEMKDYLRLAGMRELFTEKVLQQTHQFREYTSTFGSLIQPILAKEEIISLKSILEKVIIGDDLLLKETHRKIISALDQAAMLKQQYHVVVANPPYMGSQGFNDNLKAFSKRNYNDFKSDLYSMFIVRMLSLVPENGLLGLMTPFTWMFLSSYEVLRSKLILENSILGLIRPEYHSFFDSAFVPICAVTIRHNFSVNNLGCFVDLNPFTGADTQEVKALEAIRDVNCKWRFNRKTVEFSKIPGMPIAYEISTNVVEIFESFPKLSTVAVPRQGLITGDNERFLRFWHEVEFGRIGLGCHTTGQACSSGFRWFPHHKGGAYRKWYGNHEYVVDWENDGQRIREFIDVNGKQRSRPQNTEYYFTPAITWTSLTVSSFNCRISRGGFVYDAKGPLLHPLNDYHLEVLGALLNSNTANYFLNLLAPTMDYNQGPVGKLPFKTLRESEFSRILEIVKNAERIAAEDWDNFETSWDFHDQPMLRPGMKGTTLEASWWNWGVQRTAAIRRMQELETENNQLFINAYGLQDELTPDVPEEQITLARSDRHKDVAAFLSYAVGCMMGRYSLDHPGLILANAGDTMEKYLYCVSKQRCTLDLGTALAEPLSVVLRDDGSPKCFCCSKINSLLDAWFILADIYDRPEGQICGRPMIYCKDCLKEKERQISLSRRLCDLSLPESINKKWSAPETLNTFLELADCFEQREPAQLKDLTFIPDDDGIIPVLDREWFEDDIVARTRDFLRATFGEDALEENLRFIEESLGKDLRKYFLTDFYKDHLQTYKKRPIYWLFQSPKKGFSALIYMHRYTRDTINALLNRYLRDYMHKLRSRIEHLEHVQSNSGSAREKTAARKESDTLKKTLRECEEYEREIILPLAQQRIELDLDDGVKVNYLKFGKALAPIPGLAVKEDEG